MRKHDDHSFSTTISFLDTSTYFYENNTHAHTNVDIYIGRSQHTSRLDMSTHNNYNYYTTRRATKEDWWRALLWDTHLFRTGHIGVGMEFVLFLFLYHYYYPSFYHFLTRDSLFSFTLCSPMVESSLFRIQRCSV